MALLTTCQASFQSMKDYEDVKDDVESLKENIHECYSEISKTSEQIQHTVRETYLTKSELETIQKDFQASITQNEELSFKENGQKIAYISNQILVITNAEIRNKLSLGNEVRGWFDFIPRSTGNLSIKWRDPS